MKSNLVRVALMTCCALSLACDKKQETLPTVTNTATPTPEATATVPAPATVPSVTVPATPSVPAGSGLPKAEDILPDGEVSHGSVVVLGDGYRFQISPLLMPVPMPGVGTAYTGTIDGMLNPGVLTVFVTHEPFAGDLDALAKRQTDAAKAAGAQLDSDSKVKIMTDEDMGDAYRFMAVGKDMLDLQVLAVYKGTAYIFHAQTPNTGSAYANMAVDLMTRGSTFHVGEAKLKTPAK